MQIERQFIEIQSRHKPRFEPITLFEKYGIRFMRFGDDDAEQGGMRLDKPDWLEFEFTQHMMAWLLFIQQPKSIVQLGLGTASLTKFCYRGFPDARITAVELNPEVIAVCRHSFELPTDDERLAVLEMDAYDFVNDRANLASIDVLQVDLYDADTANGPVLDTPDFYRGCADCLTSDGVMTVNLYGTDANRAKNLKAIRNAFDEVFCLPEVMASGNVTGIALKRKAALDFPALYERAQSIALATELPARFWVDGMQTKSEYTMQSVP
jgi:spermidine synthase